ncbi:ATP-binding protein, partial [Rhodanobacter denitrificans]
MKTGKISVKAENMLPIIKKWLYSDKDIFLREAVSNASDAIFKFERLVVFGEAQKAENEKMHIDVSVNKEKGTLKISDTGIGMTEDEVVKYIAQVAFSGAVDFIEKYKDIADKNN